MNEFKLDNHPKIETGFKIPEHYFDTFSENINARLQSDEPKVISFYNSNKKTIYAIAAVLVLALCIPFFVPSTTKITDIEQNAIEDYISYNTKITAYELAEYLDKEDIEKLKVDFEIHDDILEETLLYNTDFEQNILN